MNHQHEIQGIGVQVLTSAEMTLQILKNEKLLGNMLNVIDKYFVKLAKDPKDRIAYYECLTLVIDIKYMARPECLQYSIQNTNMVERLIGSYENLYFCDSMNREK